MRPGMKMMMIANRNNNGAGNNRVHGERYGNRNGARSEIEGPYGGYRNEMEYETTHNEYNGSGMNYGGVEGRFRGDGRPEYRRDRRLIPAGNYDLENQYPSEFRAGRRRYDRDELGRFAPRNAYMGDYGNYGAEAHYPMEPYIPPIYDNKSTREDYRPMNPIGFAVGPSLHDREYRQTVECPQIDEMEHRTSPLILGHAKGLDNMKLTREMSDKWMSDLQNEDGTKGPHWSFDQVKQIMAQKGVDVEPVEAFVAMNLMYADYCKVFKKHGVGDKMDFYVDMAKSFIDDKDAHPDKLARYYQYVVQH